MSNPFADWFFPAITDLHKNWFAIPLIWISVLYLFFKYTRTRTQALIRFLFLHLCVGSCDISSNWLFKKLAQRPRPQIEIPDLILRSDAGGYSFISSHASNMFAAATFIGLSLGPRTPTSLRYALFLIAGLIGYSRIYNGVHYPSDVILGAAWGCLVARVWLRILRPFVARSGGGS